MKSTFIIAAAASLLTSLAPGALALPRSGASPQQQSSTGTGARSLSPQHQGRNPSFSQLQTRNMTAESLDLGKVGDAFKEGWGKVEEGFDKVGDWFQDLPQELKELNDKVGDDIKKGAKEAWELDLGGCLIVQCATALAPTALTCVVSLIGGNPLSCVGAVSSINNNHPCAVSFFPPSHSPGVEWWS